MNSDKTLPERLRREDERLSIHAAAIRKNGLLTMREESEAIHYEAVAPLMREAADRIDAMTWDANSGNAALRYLDGWLDEMRAMKPNPEATIISVSAVRMMLYARITPKQAAP